MPLGLDAAVGMVAAARARYPEIEFRQGDAERLPFADASFDAVVAGFVVNHLPCPERALVEFARVLRPDGRVAVTVWDRPERMRLLGIGSQQAFDADAHVLQAPRCIQTRTEHEAQIVSGGPCHIASRQLE